MKITIVHYHCLLSITITITHGGLEPWSLGGLEAGGLDFHRSFGSIASHYPQRGRIASRESFPVHHHRDLAVRLNMLRLLDEPEGEPAPRSDRE